MLSNDYLLFQCEGKSYNDRSDIWALGCVLYEMANLQKTFDGTNLPALINKIVKVSMLIILMGNPVFTHLFTQYRYCLYHVGIVANI